VGATTLARGRTARFVPTAEGEDVVACRRRATEKRTRRRSRRRGFAKARPTGSPSSRGTRSANGDQPRLVRDVRADREPRHEKQHACRAGGSARLEPEALRRPFVAAVRSLTPSKVFRSRRR